MKEFLLSFFMLVFMITGCNLNKVDKEYQSLKNNTAETDLYQAIFSFEIELVRV